MMVPFADKNAKVVDFPAEINKVAISSIFVTIQGEGYFSGIPCVFVRLAGCNYGSKGVGAPGCNFCDTDFRLSNSKVMECKDVVKVAFQKWYDAFKDTTSIAFESLVVVTGGEPTMQPGFDLLVSLLAARFDMVQIESNGFKAPAKGDNIHFVVSPKIVSNRTTYPSLSKKVLERADDFKILVSADVDSPYRDVPSYLLSVDGKFIDDKRIYISPMAVYKNGPTVTSGDTIANAWDNSVIDKDATARNYAYAAKLCMKHGAYLSIQTHLFTNIP